MFERGRMRSTSPEVGAGEPPTGSATATGRDSARERVPVYRVRRRRKGEAQVVSCYVDDHFARGGPAGRYKLSHLFADTSAELLAMVDAIEVPRKYIQSAGTAREHFDIAKTKRRAALAAGAKSVSSRELVALIRRKRAEGLPD